MPNKTAIVIAHGHYHTPALLQPLISSLHKKNPDIEVYCPQLPGSDPSRFILGPDSTAEDYIQGPASNAEYPSDPEVLATLNTLVEKLVVDEGKYVLLVAHSAGGWAVGEATKPELDVTTRKAKGEVGGLVGLFFMAAFMCLPGDGMIEVFNASTEHGTKLVEHVRIHVRILPHYYLLFSFPFPSTKDETMLVVPSTRCGIYYCTSSTFSYLHVTNLATTPSSQTHSPQPQ